MDERAPSAALLPRDLVSVTRGSAAGVAGVVEQMTFTGSTFECLVRVAPDLLVKASLTSADVSDLGGMLEHGAAVSVSWRPQDVIVVED